MFEVEVKDCPARRLAAMRHVGPYPEMGQVFQKLGEWAGPRGIFGPGCECLGVYYDNPQDTPADQLRADACLTAPEGFEGDADAGVTILELPAGKHAVGAYKGPYENLHAAYAWFLGTWMAENGMTPREAPCFEIYMNSPMDTKPEDLLTLIHVPVA